MRYYDWLLGIVHVTDYGDYGMLMDDLANTEYVWPSGMYTRQEANRVADAYTLREIFLDETGENAVNESFVSLLEVLIALARRAEDDILYDYRYDDRTADWFWEWIDNLELAQYDDNNYDPDSVLLIIEDFMNRRNIGLLGRQKYVRKMKSLWEQMLAWSFYKEV